MTGQALYKHVLAAGMQVPKVYLTLTKTANDYKISAVHRPTAYTRNPVHPSQWDGRVFAFIRDVLPGNFINLVGRREQTHSNSGTIPCKRRPLLWRV